MIKNCTYIIVDGKKCFNIRGKLLSEKELNLGYLDLRSFGYKGSEDIETGIIYCPYIPLTMCRIIHTQKYIRKLKNKRKEILLNYLRNKRNR